MAVVALTVGMIALFISIWLSSRQGAIGGAMMLVFATLIMAQLRVTFKHIKPYLFGLARAGSRKRAFA